MKECELKKYINHPFSKMFIVLAHPNKLVYQKSSHRRCSKSILLNLLSSLSERKFVSIGKDAISTNSAENRRHKPHNLLFSTQKQVSRVVEC